MDQTVHLKRRVFQGAAPETSSCVTPAAACCPRPCVTDTPTARTRRTRRTAAINTKVQPTGGRGPLVSPTALTSASLTDCGGQKTGPSGSLSSPNHPRNYPHQQVETGIICCRCCLLNSPASSPPPQLCIWQLSVEEGHVITLSFRNFSLETQDVCEFDYVEVHDSPSTGAGRVLGR